MHRAVEFITITPHEVLCNDGLKYVNYEDIIGGHYAGKMTTQAVLKARIWQHRISVGRNPSRVKPVHRERRRIAQRARVH